MRRLLAPCYFVVLMLPYAASAQATRPADDAAPLYLQAMKVVMHSYDANIQSPAASNSVFYPYPPFPAEWQNMEKAAFAANAKARALAHQARSMEHADWPYKVPNPDFSYLNGCRALANDLGDAAMYQHLQGHDADAVETIRDLIHLSDLLEKQKDKAIVSLLVSIGMRALAMERLDVIASGAVFTSDMNNKNDLQTALVRTLIAELANRVDAKAEVDDFVKAEEALDNKPIKKSLVEKFVETNSQIYAECDLTAMSLACHLYRFDHNTWPKSLNDLTRYLPTIPIDPFGDGRQTLGYVLVKASLPDGSDRPLVYSRFRSRDGLFYFDHQTHYSYYSGDGSDPAQKDPKQGGQFRDVASWAPLPGHPASATTHPLNN